MVECINIVGGGLAGCEAALQLAHLGYSVRLHEMKPNERTPAQRSGDLAELVCSNSLRSNNPENAVGLLKEEMRALDSFVIDAAIENRVPAGDALAVDRDGFAAHLTGAIQRHPNIERIDGVVSVLPEGPTIVATGPLTHPDFAAAIRTATASEGFYFYDALAPIVAGDSIDRSKAFAASRWDKGEPEDYLNLPLDPEQYQRLLRGLTEGEALPFHDFEEPKYFEGCLPVEVMASRGPDTLRFGCMKPAGLTDPRTGRWPHAVIQLRKEDVHGHAYNLVGFQTKLKHGEQLRVLREIPGLEEARFLRLGTIHRNTYIDAPHLLDEGMRLKARPNIRFAGQITGVEGYVESAAHGLLTARFVDADLRAKPLPIPPAETALGALWGHLRGLHRLKGREHEPQNINWGLFPPLTQRAPKKERKAARVARARTAMKDWLADPTSPTIRAEEPGNATRSEPSATMSV